jgi:hypothetical protein
MNDAMRDEIERYLAGGMSPGETAPFLESVRHDPQALVLLGRALEDQAYLYDALRVRPDAEQRPSHDTSRILKTRRLITGRRPEGGPNPGWIIGAVAAAAAFLLLVYSSTTPRPRPQQPPAPTPVAKIVEVPAPAPVVPAPPPRVAPPTATPAPLVSTPIPAPVPPEPLPPPPVVRPAPPEKSAPTVALPPEPVKRPIGQIEQAGVVQPLVSGQGLETAAAGAQVRFTDGTKMDLAPNTLLKEIAEDGGGKKIALVKGAVTSDVAKQPTGKPLVFTTPHATARVLGTVLKLSVEAKYTRLDVREGKVQLKRSSDNKAVDVAAGSFAIAADGGELLARPSPIDEILLTPAQGEIGGSEWRPVPDPAALGGIALEALRTSNRQPHKNMADAARVTWVFRADANRDYYVWVRGMASSKVDPIKHDAVAIEFVEGKATEREGPSKGLAGGADRALFNGYMHGAGYWWVGGDADGGNDEQPVVVRFNRPGLQTLKLYASEVPIRIDAIWISATQKTRPDAQGGPAVDRK